MVKIAIVGAGGSVFPIRLVQDILSFPALQDSDLWLHDVNLEGAERTRAATQELTEHHKLPATAHATIDRRAALDGADFVICCARVGGLEGYRADIEIPREYGIDQIGGDILAPGGIFLGLRHVPLVQAIARDMLELCPKALLIQYSNPMSILCWTANLLGIKSVGLCHSIQHTSTMLAEQLEVPFEEVTFDCAGVNHTAWFTTFRRGNQDLIPAIYETMIRRHIEQDPPPTQTDGPWEIYIGRNERVRAEIMRLTGYFHSESSHHASEYWPWFRKNPEMTRYYMDKRWDYYELYSRDWLAGLEAVIVEYSKHAGLSPSEEYGSYIIDSIVTGTPRVIYGNVKNDGLITNLPADACVEVACLVDQHGVRPVKYGDLPAVCAALNNVQVNIHRLAVEAALSGDRRLVYATLALDPLTGLHCTLPQIREMADRMFDALDPWLPQFQSARR
ncbi:MAG: alpha-galactosidase [Actinomycetota bacterium]